MNLLSSKYLDDLSEISEVKPEEVKPEATPVVAPKKDYHKMTIAEQFEYKRLQKLEKQNKVILASQYSQTHEWAAEGEISVRGRLGSALRGSYTPMAGNCKRCGNHYQLFKLNPVPCPNQRK